MNKFITKTIILSFPIILSVIFIEFFISYYPNTFNTKASYLNSNIENIEYLFLGSSHTQKGINPLYMNRPSANIAYGYQDCQLNNAIFFKYINRLSKLTKVFIEIDYHSLDEKNEDDYFRLLWYYKYYDVNLGNFKVYDKTSLYFSNTSFFKNYLVNKLNPLNKKILINKFGFIENDTGLFEKLNFNEITIAQTSIVRLKNKHNTISRDNFEFNKEKLNLIINYCIENNIEVIILKIPQYITYRNNYINEKNKRRVIFIDSLKSNVKIKVLDFEFDTRFNVNDFNDDDHLNSIGAEKFSKLINKEINNW